MFEAALFANLADLTGCMYISDLQPLPRCQVLSAVQQLSAEQFPARDWIDALCYFSYQHQWSDPKVHTLSAVSAKAPADLGSEPQCRFGIIIMIYFLISRMGEKHGSEHRRTDSRPHRYRHGPEQLHGQS